MTDVLDKEELWEAMKSPVGAVRIGDIVMPISGANLRSGASVYNSAVVMTLDPFVLVSEGTDMKWSTLRVEDFTRIRKAKKSVFNNCWKRRMK